MVDEKKVPKYYLEKYKQKRAFRRTIYSVTVEKVRENTHVLELGCSCGHISEYLKENRGCKILGVDIDPENIEICASRGIRAIQGDLEAEEIFHDISEYTEQNEKFDYIVCTEVIEHLKNPGVFLERVKKFLKPGGQIIVSTPNVVFWRVRLKFLLGRFEYEKLGILDENHLRFFTINSYKSLLNNCFKIVDFQHIYMDKYIDLFIFIIKKLPLLGKSLENLFNKVLGGLLTYQMIAVVEVKE